MEPKGTSVKWDVLTRRAWEMHAETNHPPGIKAPAGRGPGRLASTAWATFSAVKRRP